MSYILKYLNKININAISLINVLAIGTAALPYFIAELVNNDEAFLLLNLYVISAALTVLLDSDFIIRTQRIFTRKIKSSHTINSSFLATQKFYTVIFIFLGPLEIIAYSFPILTSLFVRHLSNYYKWCLPQIDHSKSFLYFSNIIATLRNLLFATVIFSETKYLVELILTIIILESFAYFIVAKQLKFIPSETKLQVHKLFKRLKRKKSAWLGLGNSLATTSDRIVVQFLFSVEAQILYIKIKTALQFSDLVIAALNHQTHIQIIKNSYRFSIKGYFFSITIIGSILNILALSFFYEEFLDSKYVSLLICLLMTISRLALTIFPSFHMRFGNFSFMLNMYAFEAFAIIFIILIVYLLGLHILSAFLLLSLNQCIMGSLWYRNLNKGKLRW